MISLKGSIIREAEIINKYIPSSAGKIGRYRRNIRIDEIGVLDYAVLKGYMTEENDDPLGSKLGIYYMAIYSFDFDKMKKRYKKYKTWQDLRQFLSQK